jgi:predicted nucleotidyltransferase
MTGMATAARLSRCSGGHLFGSIRVTGPGSDVDVAAMFTQPRRARSMVRGSSIEGELERALGCAVDFVPLNDAPSTCAPASFATAG